MLLKRRIRSNNANASWNDKVGESRRKNVIGKSLNLLRNFRVAQERFGGGRYEEMATSKLLFKVLPRGKYLRLEGQYVSQASRMRLGRPPFVGGIVGR